LQFLTDKWTVIQRQLSAQLVKFHIGINTQTLRLATTRSAIQLLVDTYTWKIYIYTKKLRGPCTKVLKRSTFGFYILYH